MADAQEYGSPAKRRRFASTGEEERLFAASEGICDPVQVESFAGDSGFSELPTLAVGEDETPVLPLMGDEAAVEEEDDSSSITSDVSDISGLTDLSNHDWEPNSGCISWVQQQMISGIDPRTVLSDLVPSHAQIPGHLDNYTLWKIIINIVSEPPRRQKLQSVNSINDVVRLLQSCKKILVLTGAGISVSCGIPDFRSRDGVYARLAVDFPDLPDPQAMFDIHYFRKDPRPFFKFARELWPGQFTPSRCHRFIRQIEKHKKLLRNYTQNIDTLEQQADISNVIQCHGSFATATCMQCKYRVPASAIQADIMNQKIPLCPKCVPEDTEYVHDPQVGAHNAAIMKPDIVFFGEGLPEEFHDSMAQDKDECDLILVIGSSLKVRPVALIPSALPPHVPQILINREPLRHMNFDVELLGDCDVIVNQLCHLLGEDWSEDICHKPPLHEIDRIPEKLPALPKRLEEPHRRDSGLSSASSEPESSEESVGPCTSWWVPRSRANLGDSLPDQTFLRMTGGRYVFPGAELFYEFGDDFSDSVDSLDASD